jgi:hypothetical protein
MNTNADAFSKSEYFSCLLGIPPDTLAPVKRKNLSMKEFSQEEDSKSWIRNNNIDANGLTFPLDMAPVGNCTRLSLTSSGLSLSSTANYYYLKMRDLECAAEIAPAVKQSLQSNANESYVFIAYQGAVRMNNSFDPHIIQVCAIMTCKESEIMITAAGPVIICTPNYHPTTKFHSITMKALNLVPNTIMLPQYSVNEAQVVSVNRMKYTEGIFETSGKNDHDNTNIDNTPNKTYGAMMEIVPQTEENLFTTLLWGIVPYYSN